MTRKTLDWYDCSFSAFARFQPAEEYTKASLQEFIIRLRDSGVSPISCNTYCRAINAYLRWLCEEGFTETLLRIPPLKTEQKIISTFTTADVKKLLTFRPRQKSEHRLHALVCLLLDTGLRIEEALTLTRDQVDLDNLLIRVRGKGEKHRVEPMSYELRKALFRWLLKHQFPLVFPTRDGGRLIQRNILRDLKVLAADLGIKGPRVSFHTLRHYAASQTMPHIDVLAANDGRFSDANAA